MDEINQRLLNNKLDLKEPIMSDNAKYIARTRYAMKDEKGEPKEEIKDILWRVALNIAKGDDSFQSPRNNNQETNNYQFSNFKK